MGMDLVNLTERLVPISDFSQGKAGKIFNDVSENNNEYIILKNNQPTAVLVSIKEYKEIHEKIRKAERLLEYVENIKLLQMSEKRTHEGTVSFENILAEDGFRIADIMQLAESVELE